MKRKLYNITLKKEHSQLDKKFLEALKHEGPATIVTFNATPAGVVNTWMSYIMLDEENNLMYIPAAGMHSIEDDFTTDNHIVITVGSKDVIGTVGPGAGFYVYGLGTFITTGPAYEKMKKSFPWIRKCLRVDIDHIEQKI
ncbi:MAG TPA: pyridoxamine 5'-phosphate oxidase family protein [Ligilactobacillus acidipiscis]|uniref:Pyridoxamine 5'-phosphate oxidase family protein n=1 Tax=Ligilactobacillus acidipiscis TaxID=89059 RepID=A0A921F7J5_9LACO|nr:pyridoxamine 5'-phosphate oxidase family protein [Ligilactobacillus acidipiscis]